MAEKWLNQKALEILNKPPNSTLENPIYVDVSDDDSDQSVTKVYSQDKIQIQLPNSSQTEELEYIPPTLPPNETNGNASGEPHFISPDEHFDAFEHFNYVWISAPELEKK